MAMQPRVCATVINTEIKDGVVTYVVQCSHIGVDKRLTWWQLGKRYVNVDFWEPVPTVTHNHLSI